MIENSVLMAVERIERPRVSSADAINCHIPCHVVVIHQSGRHDQIWCSSPEHMDRREGIRALHEVAFPSRRRPRLFLSTSTVPE